MEENTTSRVTRWTQKLLDLSLRNRLLNARDTKQILPLVADSVAALEDRLAADRAVAIVSADARKASSDALRSALSEDETRRRRQDLQCPVPETRRPLQRILP